MAAAAHDRQKGCYCMAAETRARLLDSRPRRLVRLVLALVTAAAALSGLFLPPPAQAQVGFALPDGFKVDTVAVGLDRPTAFAFAPDGRIFIAEKAGRVRVVQDGQLLNEPFADLTYEVNKQANRGLLGIAVHPNWPRLPYLYLAYTYDPPEAKSHGPDGARVSRVLRLSADPKNLNKVLDGSATVILGKNSTFAHIGNPDQSDAAPFSCLNADGAFVEDCLANEGQDHALDGLQFGPDGALYVSVGDGIVFSKGNYRALEPDSLNGKILRINPLTGAGYPNNPFYDGNPNSNRSKVYALGLRNPFRFTVDGSRVIVGDVGNNDWEEIDRAGAGANFGWPCYEGPHEAATYANCDRFKDGSATVTQAVYSYPHSSQPPLRGCVIGGDLYRGTAFPAPYRGAYFYHDFNGGAVDYLTFNADGSAENHHFGTNVPGIVQMTYRDNALYVISIVLNGLWRIRYGGGAGNQALPASGAPTGTVAAGAPAASAAPIAGGTQPAAAGAGKGGGVMAEIWSHVAGSTIEDLTKSSAYRGAAPDSAQKLAGLAWPGGAGSSYGLRIRGYLTPPKDGDYRFWIAADDRGALSLSTDASAEHKVVVAYTPQSSAPADYLAQPEQGSGAVALKAGRRYYFEVLYKQGDGPDHLSVAWQIPGGQRAVIDGKYLAQYQP